MARPRKNNADYFSHDNNMRNHRKVKAVRNRFGNEGYAVFNMLLETLTESEEFKIKLGKNLDWELLSSDFGITAENLKDIIDYCLKIELLETENDFYFSANLIERFSPLVEKRENLRKKYAETIVSNFENIVSDAEMPHSKVK